MILILDQPDRQRRMFAEEDIVANIARGQLPNTIQLKITYNGTNGKVYRTNIRMKYKAKLLHYRFCSHVRL